MQNTADPELVIGIVGRLGVDTAEIFDAIKRVMHELHYISHHIKLTGYLKNLPLEIAIQETPIEKRYETYIDACNHLREKSKRNDFFVSYAIQSIIKIRETLGNDPTIPLSRHAFVIDQIKRPEEVESLRRVYGSQFILISAHMPMDKRLEMLSTKIAAGHAGSPRNQQWGDVAKQLIQRDEKETNVPHGQRVSDVFPLADVVIDASSEEYSRRTLSRFFEALFGNFKVSLTRDEYFQNIAYQVSLTSCDTARQVGAVIERDGDLICAGFNEAPKAFGGTYWAEDGKDARDVAIGKDINTVRKRQMVVEILKILDDNDALKGEHRDELGLEEEFLSGKEALLAKTQIMDTLEYGRAVHAEMAAITMAARNGISVARGSLYCTTFPCHNCAKHIVASGIRQVQYLEPYAKSFAQDLYPDSISIDASTVPEGMIEFRQFIGITPKRFPALFFKDRIKDERGNIRKWVRETAQPSLFLYGQEQIDREIAFQSEFHSFVTVDVQNAKYLGVIN